MTLSLLSKNEIAYLTGSKEFTVNQRKNIKYYLKKKVAKLRDVANFLDLDYDSIARALVAQPAERGFVSSASGGNTNNESENNDEIVITSPRWDLNPRPKVFAPALENIVPQSEELRNLRSAS
jgi:hypothetical protein